MATDRDKDGAKAASAPSPNEALSEDDVSLGLDASDPELVVALADDDVLPTAKVDKPVLFGGRRLPETLTALNVYLARLKDVEILPIEEQARLAAAFQANGDREAAAKLVASNLRLVVKIAFQFRRQWADVMDLIAEGNLGLAEAIRKFDVDRGIPFPSYARFWIRARILAFIQENKHLIHAGSRAARKLFWRLERERRKLTQEGFEPTPKLLAERVGVKPEDVTELAPILDYRPISLDVPVRGDEDGRTRGEVLADPDDASPEDWVSSGELHGQLQDAFAAFRATLDVRDQAIWDQRLQAEDPVCLEDLGDQFGVSKERVRQLEVRIKKRLRVYLQKNLGEEVIVQALKVSGKRIPAKKWPRRGGGERRLHARVSVRFPVLIDPGPDASSFNADASNIGLGGLRVTSERGLDLYQRVEVAFVVPVTDPDGEVAMHPLGGVVAVVRIDPDDEPEEGRPVELGLAFTRPDAERDRVLGVFLLQTLLFDPDAELV